MNTYQSFLKFAHNAQKSDLQKYVEMHRVSPFFVSSIKVMNIEGKMCEKTVRLSSSIMDLTKLVWANVAADNTTCTLKEHDTKAKKRKAEDNEAESNKRQKTNGAKTVVLSKKKNICDIGEDMLYEILRHVIDGEHHAVITDLHTVCKTWYCTLKTRFTKPLCSTLYLGMDRHGLGTNHGNEGKSYMINKWSPEPLREIQDWQKYMCYVVGNKCPVRTLYVNLDNRDAFIAFLMLFGMLDQLEVLFVNTTNIVEPLAFWRTEQNKEAFKKFLGFVDNPFQKNASYKTIWEQWENGKKARDKRPYYHNQFKRYFTINKEVQRYITRLTYYNHGQSPRPPLLINLKKYLPCNHSVRHVRFNKYGQGNQFMFSMCNSDTVCLNMLYNSCELYRENRVIMKRQINKGPFDLRNIRSGFAKLKSLELDCTKMEMPLEGTAMCMEFVSHVRHCSLTISNKTHLLCWTRHFKHLTKLHITVKKEKNSKLFLMFDETTMDKKYMPNLRDLTLENFCVNSLSFQDHQSIDCIRFIGCHMSGTYVKSSWDRKLICRAYEMAFVTKVACSFWEYLPAHFELGKNIFYKNCTGILQARSWFEGPDSKQFGKHPEGHKYKQLPSRFDSRPYQAPAVWVRRTTYSSGALFTNNNGTNVDDFCILPQKGVSIFH